MSAWDRLSAADKQRISRALRRAPQALLDLGLREHLANQALIVNELEASAFRRGLVCGFAFGAGFAIAALIFWVSVS